MSSDKIDKIRSFEVLIVADKSNGLEKSSKTLLNQVHSIDKEIHCQKYLGKVSEELLKEIDKRLKLVLALEII
ncbi:MAG: Endoribonuclease MazF9 [Mycoplasmataceae bacterium]|nr:MAG: Endoribonuclease MazF9 [Mycoplasmataceae bacterium]